MSHLTIMERARVVRLGASRVKRRGMARVLGSPLLRWRYGAPSAEALTMVPQDLRPADPIFALELARGNLGLAGVPVRLTGVSPFELTEPPPAWRRSLHGFDWLRHLRAASTGEARAAARALVGDWISRDGTRDPIARAPEVTGRRIISWIGAADLLLDGLDQAAFDGTAESLVRQLITLSAGWHSAPDGYPRLVALLGVVFGDLCIAGHERHLARAESDLAAELDRQILPDGGHASRNANIVLQLMLDLLPLRQCYTTSRRRFPEMADAAMTRMMRFLTTMRLGDGGLARFNGVGAPAMMELSTVLAYDHAVATPLGHAQQSGYARLEQGGLEQGGLVLIADVGDTPPIELAGQAHAGALSFELSAGAHAIFANAGAPGAADARHESAARSTAGHNTLQLGDKSSARLMRDARLADLVGGSPVRAQGSIRSRIEPFDGGERLVASHDGYLAEYGLIHARRLEIAADGRSLSGFEQLAGPHGAVRLARDAPYAVRFHLHPKVECTADDDGLLEFRLADGSRWRFAATGADVSLEPSLHFADPSGTVRSRQIVLRGACWGETEMAWRLERVG